MLHGGPGADGAHPACMHTCLQGLEAGTGPRKECIDHYGGAAHPGKIRGVHPQKLLKQQPAQMQV